MIKFTYSNGKIMNFAQTGDYTKIAVTPEKNADKLIINTSISLVDVHAVWQNSWNAGPEKNNLPWFMQVDSGAQRNIPVVSTFNTSGFNRGTFGTTNLQDDTRICFVMNQAKGTYDITCTVTLNDETENFDIILDCRNIDWQDVIADWRKSLALPAYTYPEAATDPVYCTWYAVHGAVTADFVEKTCPVAKELGFTTLIVDDGWCYDDMKRLSPETSPSWYEKIGDWDVSEKKFPDFKAHIKRIQAMGMKYMLWTAPHLWGVKSRLYNENPEMTVNTPGGSFKQMDVNKADFSLLTKKLRALARNNGLDGLKIDFLDIISPNIEAPNSRATEKLIAELTNGLKEDNPNALIEFRQNYSIPGMLKYGTQFRANDVPFNWMLNFGRLVEIRLGIGNMGPVHADPAYWPFGELPENVSRHMMAMLLGVPMLSMDLDRLTDTEKKIIRYYINIYNSNKKLINHGEWRFIFGWSDIEAAIAEDETSRMIVICDAGKFDQCIKNDGKPTLVCNLSNRMIPAVCTNAVDAECNPTNAGGIPKGGSAMLFQRT